MTISPAHDWPTPVRWSDAWYQPWRSVGQQVERHIMAGHTSWDALNQPGTAPVRFVAQTELPAGRAYEQFIADTASCPTRVGLHDFFNGLCWLHFPATKKKLNRLQAAEIARDGVRPVRGAVRDALTVFDENAAFLQAPDALWNALAAKQWHVLFVQMRPLWQEAHLLVFGHALLEKLQAPRKAHTAHVYRVTDRLQSAAELDRWMAADLTAEKLATKPFAHLPVLGVPGWWPANDDPAFYDDDAVFRKPRPEAQQ